MLRRYSFLLVVSCAVGCNLNAPTPVTDPAEIARAARAAKGTQPASGRNPDSKVEFLYFTATWCGPCRQVKPLFYKCKAEFPDVQFRELDVDAEENGQLTSKYNVLAIPYFVILIDGRTVASNRGAFATKDQMAKFLRIHTQGSAD
jgi:thiol-disulfide isomerase/thioredoxin